MDGREQRGLEIAATRHLGRRGDLWLVPSQSSSLSYTVNPDEAKPSCSCPDFETRGQKCKHVFAVEFTMRRETTTPEGDVTRETVRVTYRQEWSAYNAAQTNEKAQVATLLRDLCRGIDNPVQGRGRPRLPLSDLVFCAAMKVYAGTSGRRCMTDLHEYAAKGYIDRAPHYNSVFNALDDPALRSLLSAMIEESATPLTALESDFAADASGFATNEHERWYSHKYGRNITKTKWLKAHVMIGTRTNVVTAVDISESYGRDASDTLHLPALLDRTVRRGFGVEMVSADGAYLSRKNLDAIESARAVPFIPFKRNTAAPDAAAGGHALWNRMYFLYMYRREEFLAHYHKRSNVETTFSMIKGKFGTRIRAKSSVAQVNELLCKILCHNLCCLVQSFYELGIVSEFWKAS